MKVGDVVELRYGSITPGQRRRALVVKDTGDFSIQIKLFDDGSCENVNKNNLRVISESR